MEKSPPSRAHLSEAKQMRGNLLRDPLLYIESIGKVDLAHLVPNPDANKRGKAILRLILGATEEMPFRGLSYIDSAVRTAERLDVDQLQIIHANAVGERINGINKSKADNAAVRLADAAAEITAMSGDKNFSVLHAIDTPLDTEHYESLARLALENDQATAEKLMRRGAKHGGDALAYTAVHSAFQDTNKLELRPAFPDAPAQVEGERIISIGCQQEIPFYLARMAMRRFADDSHDMIEETAQVFTKHVVPPYYFARGGEPTLAEGIDPAALGLLEADAASRLDLVGDIAARRDIEHFVTVNAHQEITHE